MKDEIVLKEIVVFGEPGVGKTCFCDVVCYLAYLYSSGNHKCYIDILCSRLHTEPPLSTTLQQKLHIKR